MNLVIHRMPCDTLGIMPILFFLLQCCPRSFFGSVMCQGFVPSVMSLAAFFNLSNFNKFLVLGDRGDIRITRFRNGDLGGLTQGVAHYSINSFFTCPVNFMGFLKNSRVRLIPLYKDSKTPCRREGFESNSRLRMALVDPLWITIGYLTVFAETKNVLPKNGLLYNFAFWFFFGAIIISKKLLL